MNYPYANGNIKALENKVLDRNKLFVLTKYEKTEFVKVLLAMNYGNNGSSVEELILNEMMKVKELIDSISPDIENTNIFFLVNDVQNIKILYKMKKFSLMNKEKFLQDNGSIQVEKLTKVILLNNYDDLNKKEKRLFENINNKLEEITTPKELSIICDQEIYKFALSNANNIMKKYLNVKIDFTNILSMLRAKNLKWDYIKFQMMFIDGGMIKKDLYKEIYDKDIDVIIKALDNYYNDKIGLILSKNSNNFSQIEVSFDRLLMLIMSDYKDDPFIIGPIIYYYLLKQAEAQNIRLLYSKVNVEMRDLI